MANKTKGQITGIYVMQLNVINAKQGCHEDFKLPGKHNKAGNQTAMDFFWFFSSIFK